MLLCEPIGFQRGIDVTPTNYLQCDTDVYGHGRGNGDGQDNGDGHGNGDGNSNGDGNNSGQILSWRAG